MAKLKHTISKDVSVRRGRVSMPQLGMAKLKRPRGRTAPARVSGFHAQLGMAKLKRAHCPGDCIGADRFPCSAGMAKLKHDVGHGQDVWPLQVSMLSWGMAKLKQGRAGLSEGRNGQFPCSAGHG